MPGYNNTKVEFHIYALLDPRNNMACYVGMSKEAQIRFNQHLINPCSLNMLHWINELNDLGLQPILQILEVVSKLNNISSADFRLIVYEREAYWIGKYFRGGCSSSQYPWSHKK